MRFNFIILLLLFATMANAETYYLREDGTTTATQSKLSSGGGCEAASTSMNLETYTAYADKILPGDTIFLCADGGTFSVGWGTAVDWFKVKASGASGNPIIVDSDPNNKATITGLLPIDEAACVDYIPPAGHEDIPGAYSCKRKVARHLEEDGIPLKGQKYLHTDTDSDNNGLIDRAIGADKGLYWAYTPGDWHTVGTVIIPTSGVITDHEYFTRWGSDIDYFIVSTEGNSHIEIRNIIIDKGWYGFYIGGNSKMVNDSIEGITVHDVECYHTIWCVWSQLWKASTLDNTKIYNVYGERNMNGISLWTRSGGPGGDSYSGSVNNCSVTNNNFQKHVVSHNVAGTPVQWSEVLLPFGIYKDKEGISFQEPNNCYIADNKVVSDIVDHDSGSLYTQRCLFIYHNNTGVESNNNTITRNYCEGQFNPAIYINGPGSTFNGNRITNNIINASGLANTSLSYCFNLRLSNDKIGDGTNYFLNNTCIANGVSTGLYLALTDVDAGKWVISNNIIKTRRFVATKFPNSSANLKLKNNFYYTDANTDALPYYEYSATGKKTQRSLADWQAAGYDEGSFEGTPLFVNEANGDYAPLYNSPVVNAGASSYKGDEVDYNKRRPTGKPDIGAIEYAP